MPTVGFLLHPGFSPMGLAVAAAFDMATRLIGVSVERELDGTLDLDFAEEGLRCALDVPLSMPATSFMSPASNPH